MKHFRKLVFVMGVFSILALLPEFASAQQFSQGTPGSSRVGERYGNFSFNPNTVSWKNSATAIQLVQDRMNQLEGQVGFQSEVRFSFYKLVLSQLQSGVSVKDSVVGSGKKVASDYNAVALLNTVVGEAAQLLTN